MNFNAGVVGAGEAVIESSVTGNEPENLVLKNEEEFFQSHDQIFLPINNPLSPHGHVYMFLQELGQGVQHVASKVPDLPNFIARSNQYRKITGEGLSFLKIPRSYYGYLQDRDFKEFEGLDLEGMYFTV